MLAYHWSEAIKAEYLSCVLDVDAAESAERAAEYAAWVAESAESAAWADEYAAWADDRIAELEAAPVPS